MVLRSHLGPGGVSLGEIHWVRHGIDNFFRTLPNLALSRVYGKALVGTHEIERTSGPGAICFVDESASKLLMKANSNFFLEGAVDALVWANAESVADFQRSLEIGLNGKTQALLERRHLKATYDYFQRLRVSGKTVEDTSSLI